MKLYRVIIVLTSLLLLTNCSTPTSPIKTSLKLTETEGNMAEMPNPIFLGEDVRYSMPMFFFRATQYMRFRLNKEEKQLHLSAVFHMLNNTPNGIITSWHSKKRIATGKVRVIRSYPISGGYCRTYQAYIKLNGSERHMTNKACRTTGATGWSFYN